MSNRKSLGHSPLGYNVIGNSNFDFIPDYNSIIETDEAERSSDSFDNHTQVDNNKHLNEKSPKKIVSYYIEEKITNRLRDFADDHKSSYSAAASEAISEYVTRKGY